MIKMEYQRKKGLRIVKWPDIMRNKRICGGPGTLGSDRQGLPPFYGRTWESEGRMKLWMAEGDAWALLARMLGGTGLPAIGRTEDGKPFFLQKPDLHFNLSHSGGLALCGVGRVPLGVDVEQVRPRRAGLARYVLSEEEFAWFQSRGGDWGSLYTLWTLKEARVKCLGTGLRQAPRTIGVPLLQPGQSGKLDGLNFRAYGGEGWRAAVCTAGDEPLPQRLWGKM